jgi:hypothetical protein
VFGCDHLSAAVFVEDVHKMFDSFKSVKRAAPGKALRDPLSDNSSHTSHCTKASMWKKSWIFKKPTPSQSGWNTDIGAVQHVWRTLKSAGFDYLEILNLNQDPTENTFGFIRWHCGLSWTSWFQCFAYRHASQ